MKKYNLALIALISTSLCFSQQLTVRELLKEVPLSPQEPPAQIMFLGTTHFGQEAYYKSSPHADLFNESRQKEVADINRQLKKYNPDIILIERSPAEQHAVDSQYALFKTGKIQLKDIGYGRAEEFQFGYQLARELDLPKLIGVDYYQSISNRILAEGENIGYFQNAMNTFSGLGRKADQQFKDGKWSVKDYILFLNAPQVLEWTYQTMYIVPAKVRNGKFANPPVQYIDTNRISTVHIGAEYISIFYGRELKIYANIVTTQLKEKGKRILVIMGQRHAAVLTQIFEHDPAYKIVGVGEYVK